MTNPSITPANKGGCSCNFYPCIHYPATSDEWQQRVKISEILVKWHMPTRQSAISELMKLIAEETRKARVEVLEHVKSELPDPDSYKARDREQTVIEDAFDNGMAAYSRVVNSIIQDAQLAQPLEEGKV